MPKNKQIESTEETNGFTIPVIMQNPMHKANDDAKLVFETSSTITGEQFAELRKFKHQEGWLLFRMNSIKVTDVPKEDTPISGKSPSKQMRDLLWVWWETLGKPGPQGMSAAAAFELFYIDKMGLLNDYIRTKLPKR